MHKIEKTESIVSGVLKFSISSWANLIIGFLSIVVTTRLLAPDTYGFINLFIAFSNVLMYVISFGFDGALIRFYNEPPSQDTKNQLLYKCITMSIVVGVAFGIIAVFLLNDLLSSVIFGFPSRVLVALVFIYALECLILRYFNISFRMTFNSLQYNIQNIINSSLMRILIIVSSFFFANVVYYALVIAIGYGFVVVMYLIIQKNQILPYAANGKLNFSLSLRGYSEYLKFALFNAPIYVINYANTFLSLQIIRSFCGVYSVGIFSSASLFSSIVSALSGGFSTYWLAYVYKNYDREQARIKKMHSYILLCAIILASLFVIFRDVVYLFIGNDYHESKVFYSLLLVTPILNLIVVSTQVGIGIAKKNQFQLITTVVTILTNIGACILLIPAFNVTGAAIASAISGLLQFALNTWFGQKNYSSIDSQSKSLFAIGLLLLILVLPVFFLDLSILIPSVLMLDLLALVVFRQEAIEALLFVRKVFKREV